MSFAEPDALWLLALAPLAAASASWLWRRRISDVRAWAAPALWSRLNLAISRGALVASLMALTLAIVGLALALARPRWGTIEQRVERQGVDVVFVLDSSLSMEARDVSPSRMEIAKSLVRRMVAAMPANRVALVQAEGERMVLAPLTVDSAVIDLVMDTVFSGSLPNPGTRLAPALRDSLDLFPPESERHRAVVLISDGEDHGGGWEPVLERLEQEAVVVHSIGIGTSKGAPIPLPAGDGPDYKQDENGQIVVSRLQEQTLREVAARTGGVFLPVDRPGADPDPVLAAIGNMDRRSFAGETLDLQAERFQWPLAAGALALGLHLLISPFAATGPDRRRGRR